ncbi:MAG TPA: hypothetical protein VJ850_09815 [Candidatus Limnocylindrales bacterium]|nr:hypothetical protein [Candidatus Limnocylindrales bacterium]
MTRLLRIPPQGRSGDWLVALSVALVLAIQPIWPDRTAIGVAGAIGLTLLAATRWKLRWLPVIVLVGCAIALRLAMFGTHASDVSDVTRQAIQYAFGGDNPYGFGYGVSRPIGAPFPYGPVDLLWYAPFAFDPTVLELMISIGITIMLAIRAANGRPVGLAIFALAPPLVLASVDGSNDTSAGLLILAALVLAARRPKLGAALLAVAVAFKPYAIAWLPPLVAFAGIPTLGAFLAASVVAWAPVIWPWGIGSYFKSLQLAQETHLRSAYWSLGAILDSFAPDAVARALETIRYFVAGLVAIYGSARIRTMDGVILVGTLVFLIAQFAGYFGSYVYLAAIAPILCWRVDDWVRRALPEAARAYEASVAARVRSRAPVPAPARAASTSATATATAQGAARAAATAQGATAQGAPAQGAAAFAGGPPPAAVRGEVTRPIRRLPSA